MSNPKDQSFVSTAPATPASRWNDWLGRGILALVMLLTLGAFADGVIRMRLVAEDRLWIETWRTFAYGVFAGLFMLLAFRPRSSPGIWELTIAHKLAMTIGGVWIGERVPEVSLAVRIDLALVVLLTASWALCRGWLSWTTRREPPRT